MKSGRVLVLFLLTVMIALAGCGESTPQSTPPVKTETHVPTPWVTHFPTATSTSFTPMLTYTPWLTITPTLTMNPTQEAKAERAAYFAAKCRELYFTTEYMSPDLRWAICRDFEKIRVLSIDGQQWDVSIIKRYGIESFTAEISPIYWTHDDQYVYIRCFSIIDGAFTFESTIAVWRIHLKDGTFTELIKPESDQKGLYGKSYSVSISPTGRRFAYIPQYKKPLQLTIIDLISGESTSIGLRYDFLWAGSFHWSPDGTKLVFELASPSTDMDSIEPAYFALMYFDFKDSSSAIFTDHLQDLIRDVKVEDYFVNYEDSNNNKWQFDFQTHTLSLVGKVTPTPTP
jgi:hypothetical protein